MNSKVVVSNLNNCLGTIYKWLLVILYTRQYKKTYNRVKKQFEVSDNYFYKDEIDSYKKNGSFCHLM